MIRHWLHLEPPQEDEAWISLVAQALWLEKRHNEALGKIIHGKGK
jgi:hypothetical protein